MGLTDLKPFTRRTADMGMATIQKGMHLVIQVLFSRSSQRQLLVLANTIERTIIVLHQEQ